MSIACRTGADPAYSCTPKKKKKKKNSLFLSPYFLIFNFFITSSPSESVVMYPSFSFCIRPYKTICWPILLLC
ncbi:metallothionein-like protein 3B [Iris pallida]|uniref:Metallothionein-like protein 3B n=1 Tax=Iris pallida TaxID=29817 RepID=A0AAX6EM66_IRIPA|nr:metallothionein-like protein 3B [Iris pallida]